MKAKNYREMSSDELLDKIEEFQKHLFELKSQSVTEKAENSMAMRNIRKDIARIKTVIRERR